MASATYERLSAQDSSFVLFEGGATQVHVTAVAIFEAKSLRGPGGEIDIDRIRGHLAARLHRIPHYRQCLSATPIQRHPIWVDDTRFDINYHVRPAGLPRPGSQVQLREFASHIASRPLDHSRPLWELWFADGLEGDRLAVVAKIHHCMIDGVSGVGILTLLLSPTQETTVAPAPRWAPRRAPNWLGFLQDGVRDTIALSAATVSTVGNAILRPQETATGLLEGANSLWTTLATGIQPPAETPLNGTVGSQRRIDWCQLDLAEVRDLRKHLGGSVNDVVLCVVAGAVRRYLKRRRVKLAGLDYRVVVPVDARTGRLDLSVANKVSAWFVSLPIGEPKPLRRFEKIRTQTRRLKRTRAAIGIDAIMRLADFTGSTRLSYWLVSLVNVLRPYNLIVTNLHGPEVPLYLLGTPLLEFYPALPLFDGQGLAVAAMSYRDKINIGLTGDWDLAPDLDAFAADLPEAFAELQRAAEKRKRR